MFSHLEDGLLMLILCNRYRSICKVLGRVSGVGILVIALFLEIFKNLFILLGPEQKKLLKEFFKDFHYFVLNHSYNCNYSSKSYGNILLIYWFCRKA